MKKKFKSLFLSSEELLFSLYVKRNWTVVQLLTFPGPHEKLK